MVALIYALAHAQHPQPQPPPRPQGVVVQEGRGPVATAGARVTVHFTAKTADGKTVADTQARGMAFTFLMDQDTVEPFWSAAARGMREGGVKAVRIHASTVGVVEEGDPELSITITLVKVAPLGR